MEDGIIFQEIEMEYGCGHTAITTFSPVRPDDSWIDILAKGKCPRCLFPDLK